MRLIGLAMLFSLVECTSFIPEGKYAMKNSPKTILIVNAGSSFQFILDYKNPNITGHMYPERYYFQTQGTWKLKGRNLILNSGIDSVKYDPFYIISAKTWGEDSSRYIFSDLSHDTIPIVSVKSSQGKMEDLNNRLEYSTKENTKDTLQFYFFGYRPVTIVNPGENKDYRICVVPEYRPSWLKDMKLKIKIYRKHRSRIVTLNWKYLQKRLNEETNKRYAGPPLY